jgi:hypothetical protein
MGNRPINLCEGFSQYHAGENHKKVIRDDPNSASSSLAQTPIKFTIEKRNAKIQEVEKYGVRARGRAELLQFYRASRLTRQEAIAAYCYSCLGLMADGIGDCEQLDCPLHEYMPYAPRCKALTGDAQTLPEKRKEPLV